MIGISIQPTGRQRGAVAVELAVVLPVLLLLMTATAELGRLMYQYNTLTKAGRDGARYAAAHAAFGSSGVVIVDETAGSPWRYTKDVSANLVVCGFADCTGKDSLLPGLDTSDVTVSSPDPQHVTVAVDYRYQPFVGATLETFGFGSAVDLAVPLRATMTMRAL